MYIEKKDKYICNEESLFYIVPRCSSITIMLRLVWFKNLSIDYSSMRGLAGLQLGVCMHPDCDSLIK
jgi:hypothetical protein